MGFLDFLFGTPEPRTMTGNEVRPDAVGWWHAPSNDGVNGEPPELHNGWDGWI